MVLHTDTTYTLEDIIKSYKLPVYIRKESWSPGFIFKVEYVENEVAKGTAYKNGKKHHKLFGDYKYRLNEQFYIVPEEDPVRIADKNFSKEHNTQVYDGKIVLEEAKKSDEETTKFKISSLRDTRGSITDKAFKIDTSNIYEDEKTHLNRIISIIKKMIVEKRSSILTLERPNWMDSETQGRGIQVNSGIKEYHDVMMGNENLEMEIDSLNKAEKGPYFAHIAIQFEGINDAEDVFIGERLIYDNNQPQVISWQSPLGSLAYDKDRTSININNSIANVDFKRNVVIDNGQLSDVFETYNRRKKQSATEVAMVYDEFLVKIMREKRGHKELTNIIPTIQSNQNQIIRAPQKENFIVQGCAGCGKTMILLHRISYLLYNFPGYAQGTYLVLSPSRQFNEHIKPLLTELRLNSVGVKSVVEYYIDVLCRYYQGWNELKDDSRLYNDNIVEPQFAEIFYSTDYAKSLERRVNKRIESHKKNEKAISELEKERNKLKSEFKDLSNIDSELESLKRKRRISIFDEEFTDIIPAGMKYGNRKRPNCKAELYATVLLNYYCYGPKKTYPFVFVDEGQDLTKQEYILLSALNPNAVFNIYGDIMQQIYGPKRSINSWDNLNAIGSFSRYSINENYRNTLPITDFINDELMMDMTALGLDGNNVSYISSADITSIRKTAEANDRFAVIYATDRSVDLKAEETIGFQAYSVSDVKGMEFETVVVFANGMSDNELYIAFSRALSNLYICTE